MLNVFLTGGTGYLGQQLAPRLLARDCRVRMLFRPGSEHRVAPGALAVPGNALCPNSVTAAAGQPDVFVHLIGVAHPSPSKAAQFRDIDLKALQASAEAARRTGRRPHFVFVSVAQPAPAMRAYVEVRRECEQILSRTALPLTLLRPWYVLGPGHRWPLLLKPFYWLAERLPATGDAARRLGLVSIDDMTDALEWAVFHPPAPRTTAILDVPAIRSRSYRQQPC